MITANLQEIAQAVLSRAQRQGSVTPEEIQEELTRGSIPQEMWQEVLTLCRRSLRRRQGRYHFVSKENRSVKTPKAPTVPQLVRRFIRRHKQAQRVERREQDRIELILPVRLLTEDHREMNLLSRDLSTAGLRLIGTRSLLGQKVRVFLGTGNEVCTLMVRILWTCTVGDNLFENGGMFLEGEE